MKPRPRAQALCHVLRSVRTKVLALTLASVILPSAVFGVISWRYLRESIETGIHGELESATRNLKREADRWIRARWEELRAINREQSLLRLEAEGLLDGSPASREIIENNLLRQTEGHGDFAAFALIDQDGRMILQAPKGLAGETVHMEGGFPADMVSGFVGRRGGKTFIILPSPVGERSAADSRATPSRIILLGLISPEHFEKVLNIANPHDVRTYLAAGDGTPLSPHPRPTSPGILYRFLSGGRPGTLYSYADGDSRPCLGLFFGLDALPIFMVSEMSRELVARSLRVYRLQLIGVTVILAALLLVPAFILVRQIIFPIEELAQAARRISKGQVGIAVDSRVGGEMGQLVRDFNHMSHALQTGVEKLTWANTQLQQLSTTDSLTGIANHRHMINRLHESVLMAIRGRHPLSVIMIDIDHFKSYNDRYGHRGGDVALQAVARMIATSVRETDVAGRCGGDEFLVILPQTSREGAAAVAEKIRRQASEIPLVIWQQYSTVTLSLGVGTLPEDAESTDDLLDAADRSLYRAKADGRDRVVAVPPPSLPAVV